MILVDPRTGSKELLQFIEGRGVKAQLSNTEMPAGDFCFEGNGLEGKIMIGVERKSTRDMLGSINSGRFSGHQLPLMLNMYERSYLVIEGMYRPDPATGILQEFREIQGRWVTLQLGPRRFMYSQIDKFCASIEETTSIRVHRTVSKEDTALHVINLYRWWNDKQYGEHTAHSARVATHIEIRPWSVARRFARVLPKLGDAGSKAAAEHFGSPYWMINATPQEWAELMVNGKKIGVKTADRIYAALRDRG